LHSKTIIRFFGIFKNINISQINYSYFDKKIINDIYKNNT